ncbi:hypothetical protein [Candidatus Ichthyocystis hellenicum]|uniref:hypothetical protein n=1 Tax=Candidatus Ichthyocystis hellenicum TaxID=1561003 RepID=UPI000B822B72|nr:hypothetical protein [Candidatus Ichthyocystis hellenicum]
MRSVHTSNIALLEVVSTDHGNGDGSLAQLEEENKDRSNFISVRVPSIQEEEENPESGDIPAEIGADQQESAEPRVRSCGGVNRSHLLLALVSVLFLALFTIAVLKVYEHGHSIAVTLFLSLSAFGISIYVFRLINCRNIG